MGVIPARGGSKSIPHKNIALLAGRPLLAYTCDAALGSRVLTRVILSTDDQEIASVGRDCGVEVPFLRPAELATDRATGLAVIRNALEWLRTYERYAPELVVYLQPTSPLRTSRHIDEAVCLLLDSDADSVVSVVEVPHQYNPVSVMKIENGRLVPFLTDEGTHILRRQDKPKVYARNGPAVLVTRRAVLERTSSLYGEQLLPYIMDWPESLDVDTGMDLLVAELFLQGGFTSYADSERG